MGLILAIKAFFKAFRDPEGAEKFVEGKTPKLISQEKSQADSNHIKLLCLLQKEGRLVDFLKEDIDAFDDEQVGAAVREVHRACRDCLDEYISPRSILEDKEGSEIRLPRGYDAEKIKVTGKVVGEPPYVGFLVHRGWIARRQSLPKQAGDQSDVICPAEIELR